MRLPRYFIYLPPKALLQYYPIRHCSALTLTLTHLSIHTAHTSNVTLETATLVECKSAVITLGTTDVFVNCLFLKNLKQ